MAELMLVNPKRRRRKTTTKRRRTPVSRSKRSIRRRSNPTKAVRRRRYRRNPVGGKIFDQVANAAVGAGGALAVDIAMANLPLPAQLTASPAMRSATQGGVSIAIGMITAKFLKKAKLGRQIAEGGLTVALHGTLKGLVGPSVGLSGYNDSLLGYNDSLLGYSNYGSSGGGWVSPAGAEDFPGYSDLGYTDMDDYYDL